MLILKMILMITKYNQEELANFLGVTRQTINAWFNSEQISDNGKKLISERFNIPQSYFEISLEKDMSYYHLIFDTIKLNFERQTSENSCFKNSKEDEIIGKLSVGENLSQKNEESDMEILKALYSGYNPFTGEIFEKDHIINNVKIKQLLFRIVKKSAKKYKAYIELDELNQQQRILYEELRKWRAKKADKEMFYSNYMVFNNKELINIVTAPIKQKEDLINISGIGDKKYQKYSDELFEILKSDKCNGGEVSAIYETCGK